MTEKWKPKSNPWASGLVGRCFVHFDEHKAGLVQHQGIVRAKITETVYLVQYFDWIVGEPSTLQLLPLDQMTGDANRHRGAGDFEFFEDDEHLRFWMEHRYNKPEDKGA